MIHVPAFMVKETNIRDEIQFNQLHNGTDVEDRAGRVSLAPSSRLGFEVIPWQSIECEEKMPGAIFRAQICRLTIKYGNWGSVIATQSGRVIASRQVAVSHRSMKEPLRVFRIPDEKEAEATNYTSRQYGEYSYEHIPRSSWVQTLAQPYRLRKSVKRHRSCLYEDMLLKDLQSKDSVLDFGCGQGDYADQLCRIGFQVYGVEFFFRADRCIDTAAVHRMVDKFVGRVRSRGFFDRTICDSVLNSVNTLQAQADVLNCLNAFTRPGGLVYVSSRKFEGIDSRHNAAQHSKGHDSYRYFIDKDGFTGHMREGSWYFQKYHSQDELAALVESHVGPVGKVVQNSGYWLMRAEKRVTLPEADVEASIRREFDLDWPEGKRVNRHEEAVAAWRVATGIV